MRIQASVPLSVGSPCSPPCSAPHARSLCYWDHGLERGKLSCLVGSSTGSHGSWRAVQVFPYFYVRCGHVLPSGAAAIKMFIANFEAALNVVLERLAGSGQGADGAKLPVHMLDPSCASGVRMSGIAGLGVLHSTLVHCLDGGEPNVSTTARVMSWRRTDARRWRSAAAAAVCAAVPGRRWR